MSTAIQPPLDYSVDSTLNQIIQNVNCHDITRLNNCDISPQHLNTFQTKQDHSHTSTIHQTSSSMTIDSPPDNQTGLPLLRHPYTASIPPINTNMYNPFVPYPSIGYIPPTTIPSFLYNPLLPQQTNPQSIPSSIPSQSPTTTLHLDTSISSIATSERVLPGYSTDLAATKNPTPTSTLNTANSLVSNTTTTDDLTASPQPSKKRKLSSTLYTSTSTTTSIPERPLSFTAIQTLESNQQELPPATGAADFQQQEHQDDISPSTPPLSTSPPLETSQTAMDKKEAQRQRNRLSAQQHRERQKKLMQDLRSELQEVKQLNQELQWNLKQVENDKSVLIVENTRLQNCVENLQTQVKDFLTRSSATSIAHPQQLLKSSPSSLPPSPKHNSMVDAFQQDHHNQSTNIVSKVAIGLPAPSDYSCSTPTSDSIGSPVSVMVDSTNSDSSYSQHTFNSIVPHNQQHDYYHDQMANTIEGTDHSPRSPLNTESYKSGTFSPIPPFNESTSTTSTWSPCDINDSTQTIQDALFHNYNEQLTTVVAPTHTHHLDSPTLADQFYGSLDMIDSQQQLFSPASADSSSSDLFWPNPSSLNRLTSSSPSSSTDPLQSWNPSSPCLLPGLISHQSTSPQSPSSNATVDEPLSPHPHHSPNFINGQTKSKPSSPRNRHHKHRHPVGGTSLVSWSNPMNMLFFIIALLACILYPSPQSELAKSSLSVIGLLPAPVDAAPKGRELVVYAPERSLVPVDYFKHYGGPSVSLQYCDGHSRAHLNIGQEHTHDNDPPTKTFLSSSTSSLMEQLSSQNLSAFPFKFLCPKPTFIVGTSEDLDDYLSTFESDIPPPPPKLVLTIPSSAFESAHFPRRPPLPPPDDIHRLDSNEGQDTAVGGEDEDDGNEYVDDEGWGSSNEFNIEEIKAPTTETDSLVWETQLKGHAQKALEDFGEKLFTQNKVMTVKPENEKSVHGCRGNRRLVGGNQNKRNCSNNRILLNRKQHEHDHVLEEIPVHIICDDIQWNVVDLSLRRQKQPQQ